MRDYELLYILPGDKSESEASKLTGEIGAWLEKHGGTVVDTKAGSDVAGRRRLAYPIDTQDHGWYVITRFSIDPAQLAEFRHGLDLNPNVLRTLLVAADELPTADDLAKLEEAARDREKEAAKPAPKTPATPAVKKLEKAAPKKAEQPAEPETAETKEQRKVSLDEKLGEILKDEDDT